MDDLLGSRLAVRLGLISSSLEDTTAGRTTAARLAERAARCRQVDDRTLARLAETRTPQGVLAVAEVPTAAVPALVAAAGVLLVLDGVQDPGNVGTLVRTAEALGAAGVVTLPGTSDPWGPKAVRAAAGSAFRLPVAAAAWEELGPALRAAGAPILAADAAGEAIGGPLDPVALVVGNEGAGLSPGTRALADRLVAVPMRGTAESLNVAAAAAILLHTLLS